MGFVEAAVAAEGLAMVAEAMAPAAEGAAAAAPAAAPPAEGLKATPVQTDAWGTKGSVLPKDWKPEEDEEEEDKKKSVLQPAEPLKAEDVGPGLRNGIELYHTVRNDGEHSFQSSFAQEEAPSRRRLFEMAQW